MTWLLAEFDEEYWKAKGEQPPREPPREAELAQPPAWASLYDGNRIIATWYRAETP